MQRWGLHRRIALNIVRVVGTSPGRHHRRVHDRHRVFIHVDSNTATSVMMFAVGISLIDYIEDHSDDAAKVRNFGVALMLGIAYSASIGGVATLIGTPPNGLMASFLSDTYQVNINFSTWMLIGVPIMLVMLPVVWVWLTRFAFPISGMQLSGASDVIQDEVTNSAR